MPSVPSASHPSHLCYHKANWEDQWVEAPLLRCQKVSDQAAPAHATGQFTFRYGEAILPAIGSRSADTAKTTIVRGGLLGRYVKVVLQTNPVVNWYGIITDGTDDRHGDIRGTIPSGVESYTAYGLTLLLEKSQPITRTILEAPPEDPEAHPFINIAVPFNGGADGRKDRSRLASGNHASGVFSLESATLWTAAEAIDYLLTHFSPRNASDEAKVPFTFANTSALDYELPFLEYDGLTVWEIINRIIGRQRGLGFHALADENGVQMKIFTHTSQTITLPSTRTIPANPDTLAFDIANRVNIQSATVSTSAIQTYDQIVVRGNPIGVVFSVAPIHNLDEGWTTESEDNYNAAATSTSGSLTDEERASKNADARAKDALHDVYSHWYLPDDWDGMGIDTDFVDTVAAVELDDSGELTTTVGSFWFENLRFADYIPLRAQVDYSAANPPPDSEDPTNEYLTPFVLFEMQTGSESEYRWVYGERIDAAADSGDEERAQTWSAQTRIMKDAPGIAIEVVGGQQHFIASDRFGSGGTWDDIPEGQGVRLNNFVATVYLPLPHRVFASFPPSPTSGDLLRTKVIDIADAYLDHLVAGSVVSVDVDGQLVAATGGLVRDDRPRLKDIARLCWIWYGSNRSTIDLSLKNFDVSVPVGTLITSIVSASGSETINTVVTQFSLDLEQGSTSVKTHYEELDFAGLI
ncbi:MAG: hypothetical protein ABJZ55_02105 [Fuerstiella sp.]